MTNKVSISNNWNDHDSYGLWNDITKKNDALKGKQYIETEILNLNCSICQLVPPKKYDIAQ